MTGDPLDLIVKKLNDYVKKYLHPIYEDSKRDETISLKDRLLGLFIFPVSFKVEVEMNLKERNLKHSFSNLTTNYLYTIIEGT